MCTCYAKFIQVGRSKITNYLEIPQDLGRNWMPFMVKNCGWMFRGKLTYIRYWIDMVTHHWGSKEWSCWTIVCVGNVKLKIGTVHGNVCCSNHFGCRYKKNHLVAFVQQFKHFKVQSYVYWVTSPKKCAYLILLWASVCWVELTLKENKGSTIERIGWCNSRNSILQMFA